MVAELIFKPCAKFGEDPAANGAEDTKRQQGDDHDAGEEIKGVDAVIRNDLAVDLKQVKRHRQHQHVDEEAEDENVLQRALE